MDQSLNIKAWTITPAILWGIYLFLSALLPQYQIEVMWFGNKSFEVISSFYPGLTATIGGMFIGLLYGIICGAFCGFLFSWTHNCVLRRLK